jgi:hypothetical protein
MMLAEVPGDRVSAGVKAVAGELVAQLQDQLLGR